MKAIKFLSLISIGLLSVHSGAQSDTGPVDTVSYYAVAEDAITGPNTGAGFFPTGPDEHWFVTPGADTYWTGQYERPMNEGFGYNDGIYSTTSDYFGNLDIHYGYLGNDQFYIYAAIEMWDTAEYIKDGTVKDETTDDIGLDYYYRVRMGDYMLSIQNPEATDWDTEKATIYKDTNGDVGVDGDGYDLEFVDDGVLKADLKDENDEVIAEEGTTVLYTRMQPTEEDQTSKTVEFAFRFSILDLDINSLLTDDIVFEANKGTLDPQNYVWRMEWVAEEIGSPYGHPDGEDENSDYFGKSEFKTDGLENVYELDTLLLGNIPPPVIVPEPSDIVYLMGPGLLLALVGRRYFLRRRKKSQ